MTNIWILQKFQISNFDIPKAKSYPCTQNMYKICNHLISCWFSRFLMTHPKNFKLRHPKGKILSLHSKNVQNHKNAKKHQKCPKNAKIQKVGWKYSIGNLKKSQKNQKNTQKIAKNLKYMKIIGKIVQIHENAKKNIKNV